MSEKRDFSKQGKRNRAAGLRFEAKVREKLEGMGWVTSKWMNTVDHEKLKLIPAKRKYNPFRKAMVIGTGFPDFVAFKRTVDSHYSVIGVEVKRNGSLNKEEKGMILWLLENKIFSRVLIATSGKKRGEIDFLDFEKEYTKDLKKRRKKK